VFWYQDAYLNIRERILACGRIYTTIKKYFQVFACFVAFYGIFRYILMLFIVAGPRFLIVKTGPVFPRSGPKKSGERCHSVCVISRERVGFKV
jgi:hypothetical protein